MAIIQPIDYRGYLNQGRASLGADLATIGTALGKAFGKNQQEEAAALAAAQYAADIKAALDNPTPQAFAGLALKYPKQREAFKQGWDQLSEGDRKAESDTMSQAYSALLAGKGDIAADVVQRQIDARKNSGLDTSQYDNALKLIKESPDRAQAMLGFTLSHLGDPKTFASQFAALGKEQREQQLQPIEVRKAIADAATAESGQAIKAVEAKYADSVALQEAAKRGWDIKKIIADIDIGKENNRIAALNAATAREGNSLRRQELQAKLDEAKEARETKIRERVVDAENAASSMDNMVNTVDRILNMAVDKETGKPTSLVRAATGPIDSRTPTIQRDVADLESLVETVGAQAFLAQIPNIKGMGALSNAEGEKLQAALQNFSLRQSPEQMISNLKEAQRLIMKGRKNLETRTGVKLSAPDTPNVEPSGAEIDALLKKYGGR